MSAARMRHELVFWALLPFVFPQALIVRLTAPRFPAASGPTSGSISGEPSVRLVAIGDSIIAGVGARTLDRALVGQTATVVARRLGVGVRWESVGRIGATSAKVAQYLVPLLPPEPADFVVVCVGVNDLTRLATLARWRRSLDTLLVLLHQHSPGSVIAVAGIPPLQEFPLIPQPLRSVFGVRGRFFDMVAREVVAGHAYAVYVPVEFTPGPEKFSSDGYHPSESSYVEFGESVATALVGHVNRSTAGRIASPSPGALEE